VDPDIPEELELVVDVLLRALSHADTIVRYSAAKGIGRICERLPKDCADDVMQGVLATFAVFESDSGWHGACLSLAESCRRNVLLPARFDAVIPLVSRALVYDLSKGSYSVGANVRDAACYVCWSVARAYNVGDLKGYVQQLATTLVTVAVTDREVNVRRAAAAAFQECVGRLGEFPDGIALIQIMDFFSLASLTNAYTVVAPAVAAFDTYRAPLMEHLRNVKLFHWDREVRTLAARAVGLIAPLCEPAFVTGTVAAKMLKDALSAVAVQRHGSILGLARLVDAMPAASTWGADASELAHVVPRLESGRLFRGRGGEYVRQACCSLLRSLAVRGVPLPPTVTIKSVQGDKKATTHGKNQEFFEDTWKQPLEWLQADATEAFAAYAKEHYREFQPAFHQKVIGKMLDGLAPANVPNERRGNALALGSLPAAMLRGALPAAAPTAAPDAGSAGAAGGAPCAVRSDSHVGDRGPPVPR
jgi:hypothetical protein